MSTLSDYEYHGYYIKIRERNAQYGTVPQLESRISHQSPASHMATVNNEGKTPVRGLVPTQIYPGSAA